MVIGARRRSLELLFAVLTAAVLFIVTALPAAALTVTFVRHGESEANASHTIDNSIPGAPLTTLGQAQSEAVAAALAGNGVAYDAIYASNMVRTTQTAAPFAAATGLTPTVLPGFREINAGWFEGSSDAGLGGIGYVFAPALWTVGLRSVPIPGGADGNTFDARVDEALQVVEESGAQNPVVFSHAATIMFWTMMNVDNPDLLLMLTHRLQNTDVVVVDGSTEEGWTLKSWAGREVGPASLGTKLFVNVRDLVVTPQAAVYDVVQAFRTGDIGAIAKAVRDGVGDVLRAPTRFAAAVVRDVVQAVGDIVRPRPRAVAPEPEQAPAPTARAAATEPVAVDPEPEQHTEESPSLRPAEQAEPGRKVRTSRTAGNPALRAVDTKDAAEATDDTDVTTDKAGTDTESLDKPEKAEQDNATSAADFTADNSADDSDNGTDNGTDKAA
ncbi:histidine phosphatase family protein [Mycobacterium sp. NPDC003323]